jgi:hypothetical protein
MRAQVHTLEAVVAALLLLTSVVFALQITAVTPLSASTSSQHIENQQLASIEGVLASAVERDALEPAVLYWNESDEGFQNTTTRDYYTEGAPPNEFGEILERQFGGRGLAYNVDVVYDNNGTVTEERMVYFGAPTDNAVTSSRTIMIQRNGTLYNHTGARSDTNLSASYLKDVGEGSVYTVVRVEVTVWRI